MAYQPPSFKNIKEAIRLREKTSGHSVFGPSQIKRIMECPASFRETLKRPLRPSGKAAQHGTMLHDVMEQLLNSVHPKAYRHHTLFRKLDENDQHLVDLSMDFILPSIENNAYFTERHVSLKSHGIPEIEGTVDLVVRYPDQTVTICDWKFGGTPVFVDNNPQLKCYALGTLIELYPDAPYIDTIIAQPALGYFQTYRYDAEELMLFASELKLVIKQALSPKAEYRPTREACKFCAAKMDCRPRMEKSIQDSKDIFSAVKEVQNVNSIVPIGELVDILDKLQEVEAVASDLRKHFHAEIHEGRSVPGYKLVHGRGSRQFVDEAKAFQWLMSYGNVERDKLYEIKPKTVAKIEKVIGAKMKKDPDFKKLVKTIPGKPQLVKEDDKREAIKPTSVFEGV